MPYFTSDIRLHCSDLTTASTLKLDTADRKLVADSHSADEGDSVSGSVSWQRKTLTLPVLEQVQLVATRLLALSEGCQKHIYLDFRIAEQSIRTASRRTRFCLKHFCSIFW